MQEVVRHAPRVAVSFVCVRAALALSLCFVLDSRLAIAQRSSAPPSVPQRPLAVVKEEGRLLDAPTGTLVIRLTRDVQPLDGQLTAVIATSSNPLQKVDMSAHLSIAGDVVRIDFSHWPLNSGRHEARLFLAGMDGRWQPIGTLLFDVAQLASTSRPSNESASPKSFSAKLDLSLAAQVQEKVSGSQRPSTRPQFADLGLQGSLSTGHGGDDWDVKSQIQLAGSSYRQQAVSFGRMGSAAPKVDIPSYLVESAFRDTRLSVGHISVDAHPLLMSGVSNRGLALLQKLPFGLDLGVSVQNGESVVGHRNLLGLSERRNQFRSIGLGYDFNQERPGYTRFDLNLLDARVFNSASGSAAVQADESRGYGGRFLWRRQDGALRFEAVYARSEYTPAVVPVNFPSTNAGFARTLEAGYDIAKEIAVTPKLPFSLVAAARQEFASPHYRSLGSGYSANFNLNVQTLTARLGAATAQTQFTQRFDNVDRNRTYMRNRVSGNALNVSLPMGRFFGEGLGWRWALEKPADGSASSELSNPSQWLPTLTFSRSGTRGYGDPDFVPAGYFVEDLPDVYVANRAVGLQWQFERVSFGSRASWIEQQNRQSGFEKQSTSDKRFSLSADWRVTDALTVNMAYDPTYNYRFESNTRSDAKQLRGGLSWSITDQLQLQGDINHASDSDDTGTRSNRTNTSQLQLTRRFVLPLPGWKNLPGSGYVRISESRGFAFTLGAPVLEPRSRRIQIGCTMSLF
jgi:hypothetical protein